MDFNGFSNTEHHALELRLCSTSPVVENATNPVTKLPKLSFDHRLEPSLTLALSGDSCGGSSLSNANVKRERSEVASEDSEKGENMSTSGEEDSVNGKKKLRLTKAQSGLLEEAFKHHTTLNPQKQKQELARELKLRPRQVEVWFQNRRARTKLKQTEVDCEYLKRCCKTLTDENQKLRQEVQELKAAQKVSQPPFCMQQLPPAATLTVCPSCDQIGNTGKNPTFLIPSLVRRQLVN